MAFIEKEEPVILNIKLTDAGRRKLSEGNLQFKQFALGDSEIDYNLISEYGFDSTNISLLRPMDKNPKIISFVKDNVDATNLNQINNLNSKQFIVDNEAVERGFFEYTNNENEVNIITDPSYIKQKDCEISIKDVVGGNKLRIKKSASYSLDIREPEIGDYLMIRWTNPDFENTNNFTLNMEKPHPILFYKIVDIDTGNLFNDNLIVIVDRDLPDFSGYSGDIKAGVIVYSPTLMSDYTYTTDFIDEAVFSFFENYNLPTQNIPFWNMSLIFTKNVCGISDENKQIKDSLSAKYGGFVNYIQNQSKVLDVLGVIHYTNASPANDYGEGFYLNTAKLKLPTIMWHKNDKMGLTLQGVGDFKILSGLDIRYRDLADDNGNIVGKVFNGLKIFVIEDPELIFALSYKSNRNWTLPNYNLNVNANINFGCPDCNLSMMFNVNQPNSITNNGSLTINNIIVTSQPTNIICILNLDNNTTETRIVEIDNSGINIKFDNLIDGRYIITVYDLSSSDCKEEYEFIIETPTSNLSITDVEFVRDI
jgi:hypothetical protein